MGREAAYNPLVLRSLGLPELLVLAVVSCLCLVVGILYIRALQRALQRCSGESRTMSPGKVWLLLIPVFSLVWHFLVVLNIAKSLGTEFGRRKLPDKKSAATKTWGLVMCSLLAASILPVLGMALAIAGFICWIVYWVRINGDSVRLQEPIAGI